MLENVDRVTGVIFQYDVYEKFHCTIVVVIASPLMIAHDLKKTEALKFQALYTYGIRINIDLEAS